MAVSAGESADDPVTCVEGHAGKRQAALRLLERGRTAGELAADADLGMLVDMAYGVLYHRLLISHAPLDEKAVRSLAAELTRPPR